MININILGKKRPEEDIKELDAKNKITRDMVRNIIGRYLNREDFAILFLISISKCKLMKSDCFLI